MVGFFIDGPGDGIVCLIPSGLFVDEGSCFWTKMIFLEGMAHETLRRVWQK